MTVRDIQTEETWHFICDSWLTPVAGQSSVCRQLAVSAGFERRRTCYHFLTNLVQDFCNQHFVFGVAMHSPNDIFSRVFRLSSSLLLITLTMFLTMMLVGLPAEQKKEDVSRTFSFDVTGLEVRIAVLTFIIITPLSIAILFLFSYYWSLRSQHKSHLIIPVQAAPRRRKHNLKHVHHKRKHSKVPQTETDASGATQHQMKKQRRKHKQQQAMAKGQKKTMWYKASDAVYVIRRRPRTQAPSRDEREEPVTEEAVVIWPSEPTISDIWPDRRGADAEWDGPAYGDPMYTPGASDSGGSLASRRSDVVDFDNMVSDQLVALDRDWRPVDDDDELRSQLLPLLPPINWLQRSGTVQLSESTSRSDSPNLRSRSAASATLNTLKMYDLFR